MNKVKLFAKSVAAGMAPLDACFRLLTAIQKQLLTRLPLKLVSRLRFLT